MDALAAPALIAPAAEDNLAPVPAPIRIALQNVGEATPEALELLPAPEHALKTNPSGLAANTVAGAICIPVAALLKNTRGQGPRISIP